MRELFRESRQRGDGLSADVREEIRLHIELRAEQLIARGVSREEAYARAQAMFGPVEQVERELYWSARKANRAMRASEWLKTVVQDGAYALRTLRRQRGFAVAAVLTLALGIGASAAIYSLVDATMLARFPFADADELRVIWGVFGPERDRRGASFAEIADWRTMTQSFEDVVVYDETTANLSDVTGAAQVQAEMVTASYFALLGEGIARGRHFRPEDDLAGAPAVAIISDALWRGRYGADPGVLGRTVAIDGTSATIVGVARPGFRGLSFDTELWSVWAGLVPAAALQNRGSRWLRALVRVRNGVSDEVAFADLNAAAERLEQLYPDNNRERRADILPLREYYLDSTRTLLLVLFAAVGILLLIACANVTNLQLVRGLVRARELALRSALGAGRGRLMRQLITESLVLSLVGGVAGIAFARWGVAALLPLIPSGVLPAYADVRVHGGVIAFVFLLVMLCTVLAGLVPALRAVRRTSWALRESQRATIIAGRARLQQLIVASEMALAVALVIGAGLMVRSLRAQLDIEPGFNGVATIVARLALTDPATYATPGARMRFAAQVESALRTQPGVTGVAIASDAPLRGYNSAAIIGRPDMPERSVRYYRHRVTPGFFSLLGIPIVRGRAFEERDVAGSPAVVIVSDAFAARVFPGEEPVGRQIRLGTEGPLVQIVGIAGDTHYRDLTTDLRTADDDPDVYFPYAQAPTSSMDVLVRGSGSAPDAAQLRAVVAAIDPHVPLYDVELLEANVAAQTAAARFGSFVLTTFAVLSLVLAAIGLYGVITFLVSTRRRDIAVRIALGAARGSILQLVMRHGMLLGLGGALTGVLAAAAGTRFLQSFLYGVQPTDASTIMLGTLLLLAVAGLANLVPAIRAARTQPDVALRAE